MRGDSGYTETHIIHTHTHACTTLYLESINTILWLIVNVFKADTAGHGGGINLGVCSDSCMCERRRRGGGASLCVCVCRWVRNVSVRRDTGTTSDGHQRCYLHVSNQ